MEEILNLSALNAPTPNISRPVDPDRNRLDLSSVINNTSIEDQVLANPEALNNNTIAQNIQTIADLRNRSSILEQRFNTASEDLSSALGGRQFAGPGQRNALAQRRNFIDAERRQVVAALEEVRGNVSTAQSLRSEADRLIASTSTSSSDAGFVDLRGVGDVEPIEGDTNGDGVIDQQENVQLRRDELKSIILRGTQFLTPEEVAIAQSDDATLESLQNIADRLSDRRGPQDAPEGTLQGGRLDVNRTQLTPAIEAASSAVNVFRSIFD